ncbi:unnamed protein product, partial [Ascophyllum nodosum]
MPRRRRQGEQSTSFWTHHVPIVFFYLLASPSVCPRISASNPTAFSPTPKSPGSWPSPLSSVSPNMFRDLSEDSLLARTMVGQQQREGGGDIHSLAAPGAEALRLSHGTTTVALVCQGGVVAAVDSRASMGSFVGSRTTQKVIPVADHILGTMAGGAADCTFWLRYLTMQANIFETRNGFPMPVATAARVLADTLLGQRGRRLSVGTMIMGCDGGIGGGGGVGK